MAEAENPPPVDTRTHQEEEARNAWPPHPSAAAETTASLHKFTGEQFWHAVTAAKSLARMLDVQRDLEKKWDHHLLLLTEELKERKRNPLGYELGPTPTENQWRLDKKR